MSMEGGKTYGAAFACRRLIRGRKNTFHRETHFMGFRGEKTKKGGKPINIYESVKKQDSAEGSGGTLWCSPREKRHGDMPLPP